VIVTARNQYTARDTVVVTLKVEPSVDVIPPDAYVKDGTTNLPYQLQIIPPGLSGTSFLWRWEPMLLPAGNDPQVVFLPDRYQQNVTIEKAKWYAHPDDSCRCGSRSDYFLTAETIINGNLYVDASLLYVYLPDTGGVTSGPRLTGEVRLVEDEENITMWKVDRYTLGRAVGTIKMYLDTSSQFYNKVYTHESVHVQQQVSGSARHIFSADRLWRKLKDLRMPTSLGLNMMVVQIMNTYVAEETKKWERGKNAREREAYAVSDLIPPKYKFQRCGRYED